MDGPEWGPVSVAGPRGRNSEPYRCMWHMFIFSVQQNDMQKTRYEHGNQISRPQMTQRETVD